MLIGYDTTTPATIPHNPQVVMAYDDGIFTDFTICKRLFPRAHVLSIAVHARDSADILDIEKGNASVEDGAAWVERMIHEGVWRPCLYMSKSVTPSVIQNLEAHHIPRGEYRLWEADYAQDQHGNHFPHINHDRDGCQWTDHALDRNLDESLLLPTFIKAATPQTHHTYRATVELDPATLGWDIQPAPFGEAHTR